MADKGQKRAMPMDIRLPNALISKSFEHIHFYFYQHYHAIYSYYAPTDTWEHDDPDVMWNKINKIE